MAPPLKLKIGKFIKDRYFFDDSETGLYFDLHPVNRGAGNESVLNDRIDSRNRLLQGLHTQNWNKNYLCGLLLNQKQVDALSDRWQGIYSRKTVLMLFKPGVSIEEVMQMRIEPWKGQGTDGFLWSSPNKVYTWLDGNGLAFRFGSVKKKVVDAYDVPIPAPDPEPIPDPTPDPGSGDPGGIPIISLGGIKRLWGTWNGGPFEINIEREE